MTIQQVVALLQKEKQNLVPSRYPCRAIMVKNVEQYCDLLSELNRISDIRTIQSSELFSSADVMPNYENLKAEKYQNEWVILTGVSEYLRLFAKKEATDRRFASLWDYQAPASSAGRIIIPLWDCEAQWFDKAINLGSDLRQEDFYFDCSDPNAPEQSLSILVLSAIFEKHLTELESIEGTLKIGLQDWFEYWSNPAPKNCSFVLLTNRCKGITTTTGNISIHVMMDFLSFIREKMSGANVLTEDNCTVDMQSSLFGYALKGISLDEALLKILNVSTFSGVDIMGKWNVMSLGHKCFVSLWLKLHPNDTYLSHCFNISQNVASIPDCILLEIFKVRLNKPEWVDEYNGLFTVMSLVPDIRFFAELDSIPSYETRLDFLCGKTREDRIYLLRMVGSWMRKDPGQMDRSTKLGNIYPELQAYLSHEVEGMNSDITRYLTLYKSFKLENTLPLDEDLFFNQTSTDIYDYRYALLAKFADSETVVLWVDALGVEWLPLLNWTIKSNCDATIKSAAIVQATLPAETCFNDQWNTAGFPYKKLDKLDKLAHKGVIDEPDYYACIEEQISFVAGISNHVSRLMEKYHRVVVTGDHGTSRLAARFFHTRDGIDAPPNAKVMSHGRYCELTSEKVLPMPHMRITKHSDGTQYAVFENYDHFKTSGFAAGADDETPIYGEVHGGATPEEMLVPLIVIDSNKEILLTASWIQATSKLSKKKAKLSLRFNRPIKQLLASVAGIDGEVSADDKRICWTVELAGIKPGTYSAQICADNRILALPDITINSALGDGDDDLL